MISVELGLPAGRSWDEFDEGATSASASALGCSATSWWKGMFLFDREPIPEEELQAVQGSRRPCARPQAMGVSHARIHHRAMPGPGPSWKRPRAFLERPLPELPAMPAGIAEHLAVERSGRSRVSRTGRAPRSCPTIRSRRSLRYAIQPETDLNAAGCGVLRPHPRHHGLGRAALSARALARPAVRAAGRVPGHRSTAASTTSPMPRGKRSCTSACRRASVRRPHPRRPVCAPWGISCSGPMCTGPPTACSCRARWSTRPCACRGR